MRSKLSFVRRILPVVLIAGALGGCTFSGRGYVRAPAADVVVYSEPPPPRRIYVAPRPGYVYVDGRWTFTHNRWLWRDGYWVRERAGHVYVPGRWSRRGSGYIYVDGRWERRDRYYDRRYDGRYYDRRY